MEFWDLRGFLEPLTRLSRASFLTRYHYALGLRVAGLREGDAAGLPKAMRGRLRPFTISGARWRALRDEVTT